MSSPAFAFFGVVFVIIAIELPHSKRLRNDIFVLYAIISFWTVIVWTLYPVAWGVSVGRNVIAPDSEAVFYGALDLITKPFSGIILLYGHSKIDPTRLGLRVKDYGSKDDRGSADEKRYKEHAETQ